MKLQNEILSVGKNFSELDVNKVYEVSQNLNGICKICLIEEDYEDNFFVSPCSCKGSC